MKDNKLAIPDADFFYFADFLTSADALNLFKYLSTLELDQDYVRMFGKTLPAPRFVALFGATNYMYSGTLHLARSFTEPIENLRISVNKFLSTNFNSALVNFYRDGNDFLNFHVDNEPVLGYNPHVASVSVGAARSFNIKRVKTNHEHSLILEAGSLLYMGDKSQINYLHALPKSKNKLPRFNVTFRYVKPN